MMVAAYGVTTRQVIAQDKEMRVDDDGSVVVRDWAVGFALGIGLRAKEWGSTSCSPSTAALRALERS